MRKIKLNLYNFGIKETIANFKDNESDAVSCMKLLNDKMFSQYLPGLPVNTFYYLTYTNKHRLNSDGFFVDFTYGKVLMTDAQFMTVIDSMAAKIEGNKEADIMTDYINTVMDIQNRK